MLRKMILTSPEEVLHSFHFTPPMRQSGTTTGAKRKIFNIRSKYIYLLADITNTGFSVSES